jgi:Xaa-Pro aminopeptidase
MNNPALRRERLRGQLKAERLDALLVTSPVNVTYLTGFTGDSTVLIQTAARDLVVSDSRYSEQLAEECPGLEVHMRPASQKLPEAVGEVLGKLGVKTLGFESHIVTVAELDLWKSLVPSLDWKGGTDRVELLRQVKDEHELSLIREAIKLAEGAYRVVRSHLHLDMTEREIGALLEYHVRRMGGEGLAFTPIVGVGPRAALPHAPLTSTALYSGEMVLIDWGATGRLYKSDLTRVLATRSISPKLRQVYGVVAMAQAQAIAAIRPGAIGKDIDAIARGIIADAGFGDYFGHGLGHGFGLQIHEAPSLRPASPSVLEPGMVVTVEPGIYLPGWGGVRIEDDILVTPDGHEILTRCPKELTSLELDE